MDVDGTVLLQTEVPTDPQAIAEAVRPYRRTLRRAGHEAGALSPWLQSELLSLGLPVICVEARHARAAMSAQRNKTDAADALGLAQTLRVGHGDFQTLCRMTEETYEIISILDFGFLVSRKSLNFMRES